MFSLETWLCFHLQINATQLEEENTLTLYYDDFHFLKQYDYEFQRRYVHNNACDKTLKMASLKV